MRKQAVGTFVFAMVAALAPVAVPAAHGQIGGTTDIITGVVTDAVGNPLADVLVDAMSLETEISRNTRTDEQGRYSILFPDGGGQYQISARMIGYAPVVTTLVRYADEDRLVWDVTMSDQVVMMDAIEVEGRISPVVVPDAPAPGSIERALNAGQIARLPLDAADLNVLATLVPGVVGIDATDSSGASFSVAGQRPDANQVTLDGLTAGSADVPQEGLRNTRVISSTYDISRGRFSGGQIASTSRSGSNRVQGSLSYNLRDDRLSLGGDSDSPFGSGFTQNQLGGGFGGPLVRNRLFAYVSMQTRLRDDAQASLISNTVTDFERLGVAPDSVARLLAIVDAIGAAPDTRFDGGRSNDRLSGLLRIDWLASNNHTIALRGDWRGTDQEPSRLSALALPETSGTNSSNGGGVMATISSRIGLHLINEVRAYYSLSHADSDPFVSLPSGRVRVTSDLDDGTTGIKTLSFGGATRMPTLNRSRSFEIAEELSWLPGRAEHRIKIGVLVNTQRSEEIISTNQMGTYTFNSLGQLETGSAASFGRTLTPTERTSRTLDYGIYAGDVWRASSALQLTYGVRFEGSNFTDPPAYNPALDAALGVRTDRLPTETYLSPRAGFTLTVGATPGTQPLLVLRGGAGLFRSPIPGRLVSQTQSATGLIDSEASLNCVGAAVPIPDWSAYSTDPAVIPDDCTITIPGVVSALPSATVFADGFSAPKTFRTSLGIQKNLTSLMRLSIDASYARGLSQYGFSDINLQTAGGFLLSSEGNRPVFVDPTDVVASSGALRSTDSRLHPEFGQVMEISSDLESETKQLSVSLGGITRSGIVLQTSYTWSHVRDQSSQSVRFGSGGLGGATTAGDPNVREWARSNFERRHSFLTTIRYPFGTTIELTAIGRLSSGRPFTPMVGNDINGDGSRNDRAFIFDETLLTGMDDLLASSTGAVRSCLQRQTGVIAERNSCLGPWEASFDLQMNWRPGFFGPSRNWSISLTTVNLLHGIDELLHGAAGAHGWGLRAQPDQTLLFVEGFDAVQQNFVYSINERFGATNPQATVSRSPFQIGIQVRATFGPNRRQEALDRIRGGGGGRGGGAGGFGGGRGGGAGGRGGAGAGGFSATGFLERFQSLLLNPAEVALDMRDSLELSESQLTELLVLSARLISQNDSIAALLQEEIDAFGTNDQQGLMGIIRPRMQDAQRNTRDAMLALREILNDEQWARLPQNIQNPRRRPDGPPGEERRPGN